MKQFILFQIVAAAAAFLAGMGFCNKHFKKFILIAGVLLGTSIAHAQTYTPKNSNAFVTLWKATGSSITFPGIGSYDITVYDTTSGGGAVYSNTAADGLATITGLNNTDVYAIETTGLTLLNFTAAAQPNNTALLQWATATEANNKGFDVQRSTDGASWIDLVFVNSQTPGGNSSLQLHYHFTDADHLAGNNFYRLKQVDLSGTATYSAVRELSFNNLATLQASPNPASGEVRVTLPAGAGNNVPYKLTGTNGNVILSGTMSNIGGYGRISVSNVAAGLYFLKVITNNIVINYKLQIVH
jgi:hypothetical protein